MARRSLPGAVLMLFVDSNTEVGWVSGLSINENHNLERVDVLGDFYSKEIERTGITVDLSADFVRIYNEPLKSFGIRPEGSTVELVGLPPFSGEVVDKKTGNLLFKITGIVFNTMTVNVTRDALTTGSASFQAIRLYEIQPKT